MRLTLPTTTSYPYCTKVQYLGLLHPPEINLAVQKPRWARMDSTIRYYRRKDNKTSATKVIVIIGPTGAGKSRLSIQLADHFPVEIINSDKIQVYRGLDITTNKIPLDEQRSVPHHLLGVFDPDAGELSPADYRSVAASVVSDISSCYKLPLVVGGSNSFIYALVANRFDPNSEVLNGSNPVCTELRYDCCFLWVDVSSPVLDDYLSKRVDEMMASGMLNELAEFYDPDKDDELGEKTGLRKAIGVPEFNRYFRRFPPGGREERLKVTCWEVEVARALEYEEAVAAVKDNTCRLAKRQVGKILRLKSAGWDLRRLDATAAFRAQLLSDSGKLLSSAEEIWEKDVVEPSVKIVKRFLTE